MSYTIEDTGFLDITMKGADGVPLTKTVDVFAVHNRMVEDWSKLATAGASTHDRYAALVAVLASVGLPGVSHRAASEIFTHLGKLVSDAAGKEPTSESAG